MLRAILVFCNGKVKLADGKIGKAGKASTSEGTDYDLDAALQAGGAVVGTPISIASTEGSVMLLWVQERMQNP